MNGGSVAAIVPAMNRIRRYLLAILFGIALLFGKTDDVSCRIAYIDFS